MNPAEKVPLHMTRHPRAVYSILTETSIPGSKKPDRKLTRLHKGILDSPEGVFHREGIGHAAFTAHICNDKHDFPIISLQQITRYAKPWKPYCLSKKNTHITIFHNKVNHLKSPAETIQLRRGLHLVSCSVDASSSAHSNPHR